MKPANQAEHALISAILDGRFAPGSRLPGERELAGTLGVTRPTLRETLSKLARDGWIHVQHGKATRVNDYLKEGGLNVLNALVAAEAHTHQLVSWLLQVRLDLAPTYTEAAVARDPEALSAFLETGYALADNGEAFARFDWQLHHTLTCLSQNPVYTMIFNGFKALYLKQGPVYFAEPSAREGSRAFYLALQQCCGAGDAAAARTLCAQVMAASLDTWRERQHQLRETS